MYLLCICSGRSCSCDVKTINPDLTKPLYLSSPFSQVNNRTDTFLAPRSGHEQPYWYSPSYFGWQYVTKGKSYVPGDNSSRDNEHLAFHQL